MPVQKQTPQIQNEAVLGMYEDYARGDIAALLEKMHPDIQWIEPKGHPYAGKHAGRDAVKTEVFAPIAVDWEGFQAVPIKTVWQGNNVVCLGMFTGTCRRTGKRLDAAFAHVFTLDGGKLLRFRDFTDTEAFREAMS